VSEVGTDAGDAAPAIDHAGGIARMMGDGVLFARVLARFGKEYRATPTAIRAALDGGDTPLALRLAHTLKGAAGMIEALPLRRAAQALEQTLRAGDDDAHAQLDRLERALARVLHELDDAPPASAPALAPPALPPSAPSASGQDTRARLFGLLDEGNGDAVDLVREAEASLRSEMGDVAYGRLADAIESFDFDRALAQLQNECGGTNAAATDPTARSAEQYPLK
jgi:HPt (histidine-containing phosphotransfer) domain-containing protein